MSVAHREAVIIRLNNFLAQQHISVKRVFIWKRNIKGKAESFDFSSCWELFSTTENQREACAILKLINLSSSDASLLMKNSLCRHRTKERQISWAISTPHPWISSSILMLEAENNGQRRIIKRTRRRSNKISFDFLCVVFTSSFFSPLSRCVFWFSSIIYNFVYNILASPIFGKSFHFFHFSAINASFSFLLFPTVKNIFSFHFTPTPPRDSDCCERRKS